VLARAATAGFAVGASLIVAIGAQNAFVLRQGLRREQVGPIVLTCIACDAALISLGAAGFGALVTRFPAVTGIAAWGGAIFLVIFGGRSLLRAIHPGALVAEGGSNDRMTVAAAIGATLAISLLNPHVYLDTVVLLGSVAAQYPMPARAWFAVGAICASAVWFCALGFGARVLAPLFRSPVAWRVLDVAIAAIMWWIAIALVASRIH
jgi:L-lysine exporter family protein LysE/ArgO